ncbi:MAG: ketoacyl-ACP synthase III [Acidimicrobiia bacterium]|nr:MAG: ketoacyl-ACP synthase III [Acidimicrobiia bacterium]
MNAAITGWGMAVPPTILSNEHLETLTETSDEWIVTRTGIKERRISHVPASDMAAVAGKRALACAGLQPEDIDLLIVATCSGDTIIPSAASFVQAKLGLVNAGAFDLNAACSGWVYGLENATAMIRSGLHRRVLLIGVERLSHHLDFSDRTTAVLFGDGAGATVLEATDGDEGVLATTTGIDGSTADLLWVPSEGSNVGPGERTPQMGGILMEGQEVFKRAVKMMGEASLQVLDEAGLGLDDVDLLVPHQANTRIIDATARRLKIDGEKVYVNIQKYGNTSAATIPMALTEALAEGRVQPGSHIVFAAFGGGLTWAAAVVRWGDRITPLGEIDADLEPTDADVDELLAAQIAYFGKGV